MSIAITLFPFFWCERCHLECAVQAVTTQPLERGSEESVAAGDSGLYNTVQRAAPSSLKDVP